MDRLELPTSSHATIKCKDKDGDLKDWISDLPDFLLLYILSLLPLKEQARTGALSHRWKNLWLFTTRLVFNGLEMQLDITDQNKSSKAEKFKFVGRVNRVLNSHQGSTLDEFRIRFGLNKRSRRYIDKWILFAFSKKVKIFQLDLRPSNRGTEIPRMRYTFPDSSFLHSEASSGAFFNKSLTSLSFKNVHVSGKLLEFLIDNCPLLEKLDVAGSHHLETLKIAGPSLPLKHLDIDCCICLRDLEIFAPRLVSFKYFGPTIELAMKHAPQLVDVSVGGLYDDSVRYAFYTFHSLSGYLSQLETLTLHMQIFQVDMEFPQGLGLTNLRHLTCRVYGCDGRSLLGLTNLIEASPFLHKFTLEMVWSEIRRLRRIEATRCSNEYLKEVELVGFRGCSSDIEFALYLFQSATALEKVVIDPRSPDTLSNPWTSTGTSDEQAGAARKCALKFTTKLPPRAKLVVL